MQRLRPVVSGSTSGFCVRPLGNPRGVIVVNRFEDVIGGRRREFQPLGAPFRIRGFGTPAYGLQWRSIFDGDLGQKWILADQVMRHPELSARRLFVFNLAWVGGQLQRWSAYIGDTP